MELSAASFAYPRHDGPTRAGIARHLLRGATIDEGFVLSTCLRVEVVVPGSRPVLDEAIDTLFGHDGVVAGPEIRTGEEAVVHLYRIASGLESPVLGEQEILTQYRQTLIEAEESGQVRGLLSRLLEGAVAVGRQSREMLPGSPHASMAAVAAQAVGAADRVGVIGSGIMATAVVEGLLTLPAPPTITVVARHPDKVAGQPGVVVVGFDQAELVLGAYPAVVSATSAKGRLVEDHSMNAVLAGRDQPLLLVDMAMPPDFTLPPETGATYLSIDDLARMADRRPRSEQADVLVATAAADAFRQYRDHHEVAPLIGGLMTSADEIVESAVRRFSGRLGDPSDAAVLRQSAHTVARTLLAGPVSYLKTRDRAPEAIDVIAEAFGVTDG